MAEGTHIEFRLPPIPGMYLSSLSYSSSDDFLVFWTEVQLQVP